jgi:hypothetical protein
MYSCLGYYLVDNVPSFKTIIQVEKLQERGHKVIPITEDEFYLKSDEYLKR